MTLAAKATKPRWKNSQNRNKYLRHYGLKVTVFENKCGGWSVCVNQGDGPPDFLNRPSEEAARAAAEQEFVRLKDSGKFGPPPSPTTRELLRGVNSLEELSPSAREDYVQLPGRLIHEGERADLIQIDDRNGSSKEYWVPHSQFKFTDFDYYGDQTIIATKWWWNRAEPATGAW
jgi:hypothetical protein